MLPQSTASSLCQCCSSPSQWRLNMNTYMNIWITDQVVIVIHLHALLPSLQSLLSGACSCAEHGLSDRMSEVGQRGAGAQVLLSGSFTQKEWPVSANAPSVCLRASCYAPMPSFFSGYHAGIKSCHLPRWWTAGVPPHFLCQWSAAPLSVSEMQLWPICPAEKRTRAEIWTSILTKLSKADWIIPNASLLIHLKTICMSFSMEVSKVW